MRTARGVLAVVAVLPGLVACADGVERPVSGPATSTPAPTSTTTPPPSRAEAIREWETRAGDHFKQSAAALEQISESTSTEDEVRLRQGCQQLHDTNSLGLQADLPTPDRILTSELQRMIDDMNTATHACLRFALGRNPVDADTYQLYLGRAVEHLHRAKVMLEALRK